MCLKDVCQLCFHCTLFSLCSSTSEDLRNIHPRSNVYRSLLCFQINISNWTPVRRWSRIRSLWNQCSNLNLLLWGFLLWLLMEVHSSSDFLGLCTWWVKYFICMCHYHIWSTYFIFFTAPAVTHHIPYINKSEMCCVGALGWLSELKNHLQALLICCRMFLFAPRLLPCCL